MESGAASERWGLHCKQALLASGWASDVRLSIARGELVAIEPGVAAADSDVRVALALPGLPNLHSHAFQRGLAGLSERRRPGEDSFWTWRELMYRFISHMTPDDVEALTAHAYMEMLEAGFTRVAEFHYLHHAAGGVSYAQPAELSARVIAAAAETGIGLCLLPVFYAHGGFGGLSPEPAQARFVTDLDSYARLLEDVRKLASTRIDACVGIAAHSLRAITPEELSAILPLGAAGPVHIHAAEQQREVEQCVAWSGQRPVEWLLDHVAIDARFCIVHATHMTRDETQRLAQSGAVAGLCPITEANLGDGIFPADEYLATAGAFGIGTDSNVRIDACGELRLLEYGQRLRARQRNVLAAPGASVGRTLFDAAVSGGARALGGRAGLAVGSPADIVTLAADSSCFIGRGGDEVLDSWIFAAAHGCIDKVYRAGVELVTDGRHRQHASIEARYRRALERLLRAV